jgi:hypothetical protein
MQDKPASKIASERRALKEREGQLLLAESNALRAAVDLHVREHGHAEIAAAMQKVESLRTEWRRVQGLIGLLATKAGE